ncbi:MAG TPA: LegC family aminotransferase [Pyrinomonadaceae bacterium]|nr:LegC family aminotransferase [Pyrinomonadaceae bacterium]
MSDTEQAFTSFEPGAAVAAGSIPLCVPELRGNEWRYVKECLDTGWVSSVGPFVEQLEQSVAGYVGAAHGVAMSTGTAALHIALLIAGVKPDDEVLVSDLTFIAPANAIRYANAWPVLIDAEPVYWQMDVARAIDFLENQCKWVDGKLINKATGRRVSAIVPVHILGHPVDIDPLIEVANKYGLAIVEDATESLGGEYRGRKTGNLGTIGCFSFNGNKIITTGGGGMLVTNDAALAAKAKYLSTQAKDDPVEYVHKETGFNYRLSNVQAALGCAQMELLDEFVAIKRDIAAEYAKAFAEVPGVTMMAEASWARSIFWLNTVLIDEEESGEDSRALMKRLARRGIQARPLWEPLHRSEALRGVQSVGGEVADEINRRALSLPSSVGMTPEQLREVIGAVCEPGRVTR